MFPEHIEKLAEEVLDLYRKAGKKIATAESCTGGLIGAALTNIAGSSDVYLGGIISYSNDAKIGLLGVDPEVLKEHGAVSEDTAAYMAMGALEYIEADVSVAVTGVAGPGGGSDEKPVGTVWFGLGALEGEEDINIHTGMYQFDGDRNAVRMGTVETALNMLKEFLNS
jgi:PncC family amidohydrolase